MLDITIINDDFRNVFVQDASLVYTDPPYPKKYLDLYKELAIWSERSLRRGGSLISVIPQYAAPRVISDITSILKWRWTLNMIQTDGSHPRMAMGIEVGVKNLGWWVKGSWPIKRGFVKDYFFSNREKTLYEWQQSKAWGDYAMKFAFGGLVIDPFMGAGTLAISCIEHGVPFLGVEVEKERFEISKSRINEYLESCGKKNSVNLIEVRPDK